VLLALWSSKGGAGTSVLAAACALVLARKADGARLADLCGDQPAIFALASDPATGLADWLAAGPEAPADALERLAVPAAPGVALLPRGATDRTLAPLPAAEAGAALAVALRDGPVPTIVDAGTAATPASRALVEVADTAVVVVRGCYLGLRRAVHNPLLGRSAGIVLVEEQARSLGPSEVADVLDLPVLARVAARPPVARAVDAGVLAARLPDALARPVARLLTRVHLLGDRAGDAA
jgi:MinD-like ATPase involved in chromosome partitioning or flagellar assembly